MTLEQEFMKVWRLEKEMEVGQEFIKGEGNQEANTRGFGKGF